MTMTGTTETTKVVVLDCLDTIQGYRDAEPGKSKLFYQAAIAREHQMAVDHMLATVPYETQLEWTARLLERGDLEPIAMPGAQSLLQLYRSAGLECRIVTADIPEAAVYTTKPFVDVGLITSDQVHAIARLGSKREEATWLAVQQQYFPDKHVLAIYEDTRANLDAALEVYVGATGFHVRNSGYIDVRGSPERIPDHALIDELESPVFHGRLSTIANVLQVLMFVPDQPRSDDSIFDLQGSLFRRKK
jgi:hypothetical protein